MEVAQQRQAAYYNSKHKPVEFKPGDLVLLSTENIQRSLRRKQGQGTVATKFLPKYIGPFTVEALVGKGAVRLQLTAPYRYHPVFHVSLIKHYQPGGRAQPAPPPALLDDDGAPL